LRWMTLLSFVPSQAAGAHRGASCNFLRKRILIEGNFPIVAVSHKILSIHFKFEQWKMLQYFFMLDVHLKVK
jgi:hypothetical protein